MIVFDLQCCEGHRFEGWFGSSADFDTQRQRGLVQCPQCGAPEVDKAPMAPAVPAKGNRRGDENSPKHRLAGGRIPPEVHRAMQALAEAQPAGRRRLLLQFKETPIRQAANGRRKSASG